jgi:hypothetical protein
MKKIIKGINQILAEWDPLAVGEDISSDEYQCYIPQIIMHIENKEALTNWLEKILINNLEAGYDQKDESHKKMLADVVEKIMQLSKLQNRI